MKWRQGLFLLLTLLLLLPAGLGGSGRADAATVIQVYLDGQRIQGDVDPYILSDTTLVPIRLVSENLGAEIGWSKTDKTVSINEGGTLLSLPLGSKTAYVNGNPVDLGAPVTMLKGRIMVPLRFISEGLGLTVNWDQSSRIINLTTPDGAVGVPLPGVPDKGGNLTALRGAWVATVSSLDWPSSKDSAKQKAQFTTMLDQLQQTGINAVFVQVRPSADALYKSSLVPWSGVLTGTPGKDPGYDPLAFMIEESHKRGMEFHAWFNPFRANTSTSTSGLTSNHVAKAHPDWIVNFDGKLFINPGIPAARQSVVSQVMEVVNNYDIDGVHLDDYFYPYGETSSKPFGDEAAFKLYNAALYKNKGDWRRANINSFVQNLGQSIHAVKPAVKYGVSPFGVWRNGSTDSLGSNSKAGVTAYDTTFADARTWIKNEWIDYVAPQIYWSNQNTAANYKTLVDWWADTVDGTNVDLYIGEAAYKVGTSETGWANAGELTDHLAYTIGRTNVDGNIFFRAQFLLSNGKKVQSTLQDYWAN
ncbi:family 10 glycosylhydrolase [Saccharibacillus sp. CPCC 101409]|uniref:family 10 glycosylhydrolase n=1 Tax=Saccharibacillus sp. CPCC 101409 TaxID=3058041 RepID=UPI0026713699|nr:family 10 glycosylhydrolase [Saccharibacillus sp. CPCC 101409]MDO3409524.1 family 10 glycosylhydrolase [Saccharibacillus sp. CPCC 101409]